MKPFAFGHAIWINKNLKNDDNQDGVETFFPKAWLLSFERFSKKIRKFVKNLLLISAMIKAYSALVSNSVIVSLVLLYINTSALQLSETLKLTLLFKIIPNLNYSIGWSSAYPIERGGVTTELCYTLERVLNLFWLDRCVPVKTYLICHVLWLAFWDNSDQCLWFVL